MTPADEVGKCPECGSIDRGTRYLITPPTEGDPPGTFCKNAWHHVPPEVHRDEFTEQELTVILALSLGMRHHDIEKHLGMTEDIVQQCRASISEKAGGGTLGLREFIKTALNSEVLWRTGKPDPRRP
jgi:hypothetical protein